MTKVIYFLVSFSILLACQRTVEESGVPNISVDIEINLSELDNAPLQQIGGFIYVPGGVRGIILRRESQSIYRAFERNCTYKPLEACSTVDMHSSEFYMEDTCYNSTFNLDGFPTGGPAKFPLKEYRVSLSGDYLFIFN